MHHLWANLMHWSGSDNVSGPEYGLPGFWSGFGGDITIFAAILAWPWIQFKRHNCQVRRCWRIGRHEYRDPDEGVTRLLCWRHHPHVEHKQLTVRHLREQHHLYLGKQPGRG
jgi:hypothetical protein